MDLTELPVIPPLVLAELLVIPPLVLALMMAVKQIPWFAPDPEPDGPRRNGWVLAWIAAALGVGGVFLYSQAVGAPGNWALCVLRGIGYGFAAVGLWNGGINDLVKLGRGPTALALVLLLAAAPFSAGCGGHEFMLKGPAAVVEATGQIEVGIDEYHAAAVQDLDITEAALRTALIKDVAGYMVVVAKDGSTFTAAQAEEKLRVLFDRNAAEAANVLSGRANEAERYARVRSLTQWVREICAQLAQIETARYDTLTQLKEKAGLYVEAKLSGRSP